MTDDRQRKYHGIILAAGYGTRLAPVTDVIPKPLIPVGDRTLLENILTALENGGVAKFAINTHHLGSMITQAIADSDWGDRIELYPEAEILGTGGPLVNAKAFLTDCDAFVLHNSDILTDIDLKALIAHHERSGSMATMVLIDGPENKVAVGTNGNVVDILGKLEREGNYPKMTYAGIAVFSPKIFNYLPDEPEFCSIITAILAAMKENPVAISAYTPEFSLSELKSPNHPITPPNIYWNDLGTVEKFLDAQHDIANGSVVLPEIAPSISLLMTQLPYPGGSERIFFRLKDEESKIIMCASKDSADFVRFLNIGKFLDKLDLKVPKIYSSSSERHVVIMEDLGDDILFNRFNSGISEEEQKKLYRKIIEWLVSFQSKTYGKYCPEGRKEEKGKVGIRNFDFDYLRWETGYFSETFLINYCGTAKEDIDELDYEFRKLAEETLNQPQVLIHRDFQSQNILFKDGEIRIVDFQGARIGHIAYDLMSLLKDPYVSISSNLRNSLIDYYYDIFRKSSLAGMLDFNRDDLAKFAATAALQRNMQALGAYGFLGLTKGKKEYLTHIPRGLAYLQDGLEEFRKCNPRCPLPKLTDLVGNLTAKSPSS